MSTSLLEEPTIKEKAKNQNEKTMLDEIGTVKEERQEDKSTNEESDFNMKETVIPGDSGHSGSVDDDTSLNDLDKDLEEIDDFLKSLES